MSVKHSTPSDTSFSQAGSDAWNADHVIDILNVGTGDNVVAWVSTTPQLVDVRSGTAASPDTAQNPVVKVSRTMEMASVAGDGSDKAAGILSSVSGTINNQVQTVGVLGYARSKSTSMVTSGSDDACGVYGVGRITGSGTGTGIGAFFNGRRDTATGNADAMELSCQNFTASAGSYNATGFSDTTGLWIECTGNSDSGVGVSFGNPFGFQYKVGIGFTAQVIGGKTGGVSDSSIRDDCVSAISVDIRGSHGTAAISVADGSGVAKLSASNTTTASLRLPHGTAPSSPVDGDMWTTSAGLFVSINGSTVGPLS